MDLQLQVPQLSYYKPCTIKSLLTHQSILQLMIKRCIQRLPRSIPIKLYKFFNTRECSIDCAPIPLLLPTGPILPILPGGPSGPSTPRFPVGPRLTSSGVVVSMLDFHRIDRGSNPGRGGKISCLRLHYSAAPLASV